MYVYMYIELLQTNLLDYMKMNHSRLDSQGEGEGEGGREVRQLDDNEYCASIASRLVIIRRLYGQTSEMKIDKDFLLQLWQLSTFTFEKEEVFRFYSNIIRREEGRSV